MTLEPVVAWVTARVHRERKCDGFKYEDVIFAPLVRYYLGGDLVLLDSLEDHTPVRQFVYLAPGEEFSQEHIRRLEGGYAQAVTLG
jgi:hypothetical protein